MKVGQTIRSTAGISALIAFCACEKYLGCTPVLTTDDGQLELHDREVVVGSCRRLRGHAPLLVGTTWCPSLLCGNDVPGCKTDEETRLPSDQVSACFERTVQGPAAIDGTCVTATATGTFTLTFTPVPCPARRAGYAPRSDSVSLAVVPPSEVAAHLASVGDDWALRELRAGPKPFPSDAIVEPGGVIHLLAGHPVHLAVVLVDPEHTENVGWNPGRATIVTSPVRGTEATVTLASSGVVTAVIEAGAESALSIDIDGTTFPVGTIRGVAESELVSLEIAVGYMPKGEVEWTFPVGARGILRTANGTPVYGGEVKWEVLEGALPVWRDDRLPWDPDYVALMDEDGKGCHPPPKKDKSYVVVLAARHGELEDEAELRWREEPPDDSVLQELGELFAPGRHENSEACQGPGFPAEDCSCTSERSSPTPVWLLAVVTMLFRPRRRPIHDSDRPASTHRDTLRRQ